jgi:Arc/MetJ family transcription regulator
MRTTIEIDDKLLAEAMRRGGLKSKREAGDLEQSRKSRTFR